MSRQRFVRTTLITLAVRYQTLRSRERGAGLVEYALLVSLIALVCVSALQLFGVTNGGSVNKSASSVADILTS